MTKAERLDYGESLMTHAMVLMGVNLDKDGKPTMWRVENSWGKDAGKDGYYIMSDKWFDEFMPSCLNRNSSPIASASSSSISSMFAFI